MTRKRERALKRMQREQAQLLAAREAERRAAVEAKADERKRAKQLRKWREGTTMLGKFGAASPVRRIDPKTGKVLDEHG
jgi:hypothetical protein